MFFFSVTDDTTVADKLFRDIKVFCWILTSQNNHKVKAVHVKATWAKRCNKYVFMSDKADPDLPAIQLRALEGKTPAISANFELIKKFWVWWDQTKSA